MSDRSNLVDKPDGDNIRTILSVKEIPILGLGLGFQSTQTHTDNVTRLRRYALPVEISGGRFLLPRKI